MGSSTSNRSETNKIKSLFPEKLLSYAPALGVVLVVSGLLLLLDQKLKSNWISISIPLFSGIALTLVGILKKKLSILITGLVLFGGGAFLFSELQNFISMTARTRLAYSFLFFTLSWFLIFTASSIYQKKLNWWSLLIVAVGAGLAIVFFIPKAGLFTYFFVLPMVICAFLLFWGLIEKKMGLVIPAVLVSTISAGVYYAWNGSTNPQGLQETGLMLVWFSLGWILITIFSRVLVKSFIWWPLIPGGVLLMVGSGLYIGGNPKNALGFVGNTGSIALILFGLYLILLKYSIKK